MIAVLQRVRRAGVEIGGRPIARIGRGLLVLVGVERDDGEPQARRLAERVLAYRVFPDAEGRMNLGVLEAGGELLVVPQFTLAADTSSGNRAGFSRAAPPEQGEALFSRLVAELERRADGVQTGRFGADMQVELVNDGPVTFLLRVSA